MRPNFHDAALWRAVHYDPAAQRARCERRRRHLRIPVLWSPTPRAVVRRGAFRSFSTEQSDLYAGAVAMAHQL
eukprot:1456821-Pleurochrysis_carterae.AAC.1